MATLTTTLGKVMPVFKGEYNAAIEYLILDEVTKDGNYYRSKRNENLNHAVNDQAWWLLISSEGDRQSAEGLRATAETTRQGNETGRQTAEGLRVTAEQTRQTNTATAITNANNAADNANTKAGLADTAATNANATNSSIAAAEVLRVNAENSRKVWQAYNNATAYVVGNKVSYNGSSYVCILASTGNLPTNTTYWTLIAGKGETGAIATVRQTIGTSEIDVVSQKTFSQTESDIYFRGLEWEIGYYYDINGNVVANINNSISKYKIPVIEGKEIMVNNLCNPIVYSHFTDRNGAILSSFNNNGTTKYITVPANAVYMLLTNRSADKTNETVTLTGNGVNGVYNRVGIIENDYLKSTDIIDFATQWTIGKYYSVTGGISDHPDYSISQINVTSGKIIELNTFLIEGTLAYCVFVDDGLTVISSFQNSGLLKRIIVPVGATKLLVSNRHTSKANSTVYVRGYGVNNISARQEYLQNDKLSTSTKFIHFSFDDVNIVLQDLTTNASIYTSIFQNPFLSKLKELHDLYGAVFSLYVFDNYNGWLLSSATTTFASQFSENSDWLKFGLHFQYNSSTTSEFAISNYTNFINTISPIIGGVKGIDRFPRGHGFSGSLVSCKAIRDCSCGVVGLLTADDSRSEVYYLSTEQVNYIGSHDRFYDAVTFLYFMKTETRLESVSNINTFLADFLTTTRANQANDMIIFTHEQQIYPTVGGAITQAMVDKITACCEWGVANNYRFDFPMNAVLR